MWQIVRRYSFKPLTLSLIKNLEPYHNDYTSIEAQILKTVSESKDTSVISQMQINAASISHRSELFIKMKEVTQIIEELEILATDQTMAEEAFSEINDKLAELEALELQAIDALIAKDPDDDANAILEFRPGVGGSESCLFTEDLVLMYIGYAEKRG